MSLQDIFGSLRRVDASFFLDSLNVGKLDQRRQRWGVNVNTGEEGNVVQHNGQLRRFGNGLIVLVDPVLSGFKVVWRNDHRHCEA